MSFLSNCWYVASWSSDIQDGFVALTILDEPILLYRDSRRVPHALSNRCPHRFAPLSMGYLKDDIVECAYHGLRFGPDGSCVFNPHDPVIAKNARIRTYPIMERDTLLWIWMGEPELAESTPVPDLSERFGSEKFRAVCGSMVMEANYQLIVDNLMDVSHGQFLHADALRFDGFFDASHNISQTAESVTSERRFPGVVGSSSLVKYLPNYTGLVDAWASATWHPAGMCLLDNGGTHVGSPETGGVRRCGVHLLTPETASTTRYFYAHVRNYGLDDVRLDEDSRAWHLSAFAGQDKPMIEAVQRMMGGRSFEEMRPVLVSSDGPAMRARRILRGMIAAEQAAGSSDASPQDS
jgi:phenylpropionate dioxygenase-like ring-hydroxylating dioxygenase large terminal subunit